MAQKLRTFAGLPEDLGSNPTLTWHLTTMHDSSFMELTPLLPSVGTAHMCVDTYAGKHLNKSLEKGQVG